MSLYQKLSSLNHMVHRDKNLDNLVFSKKLICFYSLKYDKTAVNLDNDV